MVVEPPLCPVCKKVRVGKRAKFCSRLCAMIDQRRQAEAYKQMYPKEKAAQYVTVKEETKHGTRYVRERVDEEDE